MTFTPPEPPPGAPTPAAGITPPPPPPPVEPPAAPAPPLPDPYQQQAQAQPAYQQQYQQPYQQPGYPQQPPTEGLAIAALITGILFWPVGIVLGFIALSKIKKTGNGGRVLAILGVVFGFLGLVITIIAIVASILITIASAAAFNEIADSYDDTLGSMGEVQATVGIGETGSTEAGMQFTVNTVECGIESVGEADFDVEAVGQYCRVDLTVNNGTTEPQYFYSGSATGFIGDVEYASDSSASFYDPNYSSFASELNPGQSSAESVYFDVPDGQSLTSVQLEGEILGGVVEVTLQ